MYIELCQVIYCQPFPSKHCTPKPVVLFWWQANFQPVSAMFTGKKISTRLVCRHPRSNAPTLWTLNRKLVAPRSNLGVDPHISGPSVISFWMREDMHYVSVVTDGYCSGQNFLHEA